MRPSPIRLVVATAASAALLSSCGAENSYGASEKALRDWLAAIHSGNAAACALETQEMHDELLAVHPELGGPGTGCATRVERMTSLDLPTADAEMDVPVWDPAGEALIEVKGSGAGGVRKFWMAFQDGRWLVAGEADSRKQR